MPDADVDSDVGACFVMSDSCVNIQLDRSQAGLLLIACADASLRAHTFSRHYQLAIRVATFCVPFFLARADVDITGSCIRSL